MRITQEYHIEKNKRRAFRDVCTDPNIFVYALIIGAVMFYLGCRYASPVVSAVWFAIALIPCILAIRYQVVLIKAAKEKQSLRYEFFEDKAVRYGADGTKTTFPYQLIKTIRENNDYLRIATDSCAAILKKDEVSEEELAILKNALAKSCPKVKQKKAQGRSGFFEMITALVLVASIVGIAINLLPILDGFAFAPSCFQCASSFYAEKHHIETDGNSASIDYKSEDQRTVYLHMSNYNHKECPTESYCVTFRGGAWEVRELLPSEILWEYQTDTASFRVLKFDKTYLLEFGCSEEAVPEVHSSVFRQNFTGVDCVGMAYEKIWIVTYTDGIPRDLVLRIDTEDYPVGEMFNAST